MVRLLIGRWWAWSWLPRAAFMAPMPELVGHRSETQGWVWVPLCGAGGWNRRSLWFLLAQVPSSSGCCVSLELDMQAIMKFGFSQNE